MPLLARVCTGLRLSACLGLIMLILPGFVSPPEPESASPQFGSGIVNVYVSGAVRKPGVYRFPVGTRTVQAIQQAGGVLPGTPTEWLELTQILQDGQRLHVSPKPPPPPPVPAPARQSQRQASPGRGGRASGPVMLNQATADALDGLPGIGRKRANDIVAYRRQHGSFRRLEDLGRIRGMGPKLLAKLRPYLRV
jgi:competence protein ComEA